MLYYSGCSPRQNKFNPDTFFHLTLYFFCGASIPFFSIERQFSALLLTFMTFLFIFPLQKGLNYPWEKGTETRPSKNYLS